jgi:NAD(P)-dependent dehydrogenase (short-subunit alcohol dehydrogenase family)
MGSPRRVIVITGVSRGLGAALVAEFVARGHVVLGCSRSRAALESLKQQHPPPHDFAVVDVAVEAQVAAWAGRLLAVHGAVDLLLNNAALINRSAPLWQVDPSEFSAVIDANIKGVFHVVRCFLPSMLARRAGVIVNFSSGWGRSTAAEVAPYCATKWAIEGLTQALAQELPTGLAAIPLNPGIIDTDMLRSCFGAGAGAYPTPAAWARTPAPFLLRLGSQDNGKSLTVS